MASETRKTDRYCSVPLSSSGEKNEVRQSTSLPDCPPDLYARPPRHSLREPRSGGQNEDPGGWGVGVGAGGTGGGGGGVGVGTPCAPDGSWQKARDGAHDGLRRQAQGAECARDEGRARPGRVGGRAAGGRGPRVLEGCGARIGAVAGPSAGAGIGRPVCCCCCFVGGCCRRCRCRCRRGRRRRWPWPLRPFGDGDGQVVKGVVRDGFLYPVRPIV